MSNFLDIPCPGHPRADRIDIAALICSDVVLSGLFPPAPWNVTRFRVRRSRIVGNRRQRRIRAHHQPRADQGLSPVARAQDTVGLCEMRLDGAYAEAELAGDPFYRQAGGE